MVDWNLAQIYKTIQSNINLVYWIYDLRVKNP